MNISLDLMQRQINELESKIYNEIERLKYENNSLIETIKSTNTNNKNNSNIPQSENLNKANGNSTNTLSSNNNKNRNIKSSSSNSSNLSNSSGSSSSSSSYNSKSLSSFMGQSSSSTSDDFLIAQLETNSNNQLINMNRIESDLNNCKEELLNTKFSCNKVLKMDQKKLDSVKCRFNEIKSNIELNDNNVNLNKCNMSNCDNMDIIENKEHIEILRFVLNLFLMSINLNEKENKLIEFIINLKKEKCIKKQRIN